MRHDWTAADFAHGPMMFYYETTLACDLECRHCRASAQKNPAPDELTTAQAMRLIDHVASFPRPPHLVFTGGDPLKRADLFELIRHAVSQRRLEVALTPSATPLATRDALERARDAGVSALGVSLDAADAATHDAFRRLDGSFARTWELLHWARELGMPVQVNTTVSRRNVTQIDAMAERLADAGIAMWSLFLLIPVGRGTLEERIEPAAYEELFAKIHAHAICQPYAIKTCEAPHYRRWVLQHGDAQNIGAQNTSGENVNASGVKPMRRAPLGVGDGKGVMFVSHRGEILPAGFLPVVCGRFPEDSVVETYQNHPVFRALRDPDRFTGRCGVCEYRYICGGSRSRAFALTGDYTATDHDCIWTPNPDCPPIR